MHTTATGTRPSRGELPGAITGNQAAGRLLRSAAGGRRVGQQGVPATVAPAPSNRFAPGPALPPEVARRISYAAVVLNRLAPLPEEDRAGLQQVIRGAPLLEHIRIRDATRAQLGQTLLWVSYYEATNAAVERGEQLAAGVAAGPELMEDLQGQVAELTAEAEWRDAHIQAELASLGTDERGLLELLSVRFPRIWERRAKEIAYAMLDQNEEVARRERARYSELICTPDTAGLLEADARLAAEAARLEALRSRQESIALLVAEKQRAVERGESDIEDVERWGPLPGGVPPTVGEMQALRDEVERLSTEAATLTDAIAVREQALAQLRIEYVADFPILGSRAYRVGSLNRVPREQLGQITGEQIDEILENIEDTRDNIADDTVRVWDLHDVPAMAFHDLGVPEDSVLGDAVRSYVAEEESDEFWLDIALAALGLVGGIIATFASGGLALAGGIIAVAGGGASLYRSTSRYRAESAAETVALDPVFADISANEPELLWVVLDVVGLGLDAGDVVRLLRPAARGVMATGDVAAFAAEAERVAPEVADRLVRSARGQVLARGGREAASEADLVAGAAGKAGRDLTPDELDAELRAAARSEPEQLAPGGDYVMEVEVPGSPHTWRLRRDGVWCRFSEAQLCLVPAAVPEELRAIVVEGGPVPARRARRILASLGAEFPILRRFPLELAAIQRVLAKGPLVNAMKGQLLEELLAVRVHQALRTRGGRAGLGLAEEQGELAFIEGHRITDADGRQLTDGIIGVRRGGRLEVRLVLEAKSGGRSARGLALGVQTVRQMSRGDRLELFRYLKDLYPNTLRGYVRTTYPDSFAAYEARRFDDLPDDLVIDVATHPRFRRGEEGRVLVTEQGGQVRRDVERLFDSEIRVDGTPVPVTAGPQGTRFVSALPEDVDTRFVEETLEQLGYGVDVMRFPISADDIVRLTTEIATRLGSPAR